MNMICNACCTCTSILRIVQMDDVVDRGSDDAIVMPSTDPPSQFLFCCRLYYYIVFIMAVHDASSSAQAEKKEDPIPLESKAIEPSRHGAADLRGLGAGRLMYIIKSSFCLFLIKDLQFHPAGSSSTSSLLFFPLLPSSFSIHPRCSSATVFDLDGCLE